MARRPVAVERVGPQAVAQVGHDDGGLQGVADHVAHRGDDVVVVELDQLVEVAAHLGLGRRRLVAEGHVEAGGDGARPGSRLRCRVSEMRCSSS
jgi:hypothetical protein